MTMMGLDIETIEHLDFEFVPPCEQSEGCENSASWKVIPACCGRTIYFCEPCKEYLIFALERSPYVTDMTCGTKKTTIVLIERLK